MNFIKKALGLDKEKTTFTSSIQINDNGIVVKSLPSQLIQRLDTNVAYRIESSFRSVTDFIDRSEISQVGKLTFFAMLSFFILCGGGIGAGVPILVTTSVAGGIILILVGVSGVFGFFYCM